jgi:hypothetical protein
VLVLFQDKVNERNTFCWRERQQKGKRKIQLSILSPDKTLVDYGNRCFVDAQDKTKKIAIITGNIPPS